MPRIVCLLVLLMGVCSQGAAQDANMLSGDVRRRLFEANQRESAAWQRIQSAEDWQRYVKPRIQAMKEKLGIVDPPQSPPQFMVTGRIQAEGYQIENVVFEGLSGVAVTANLYRPRPPKPSMPAVLIVHSHHAPKTQGELQDMGITWARQGAVVLVIDQPGHGERRQHKFVDEASYPKSFRVSRQDYYFRYNLGLQLPLVGRSLMAWMVYDLRRGIDLVTSLEGVDGKRIALLGAVAGGGDPCAVTAAVDERISVAAPFNFGGPQPETRYPLPDDAETSFNYAGGGSWESTRNLQFSAAEGFLPWVIVGSIAPRGFIYGHEFSWDRPRDPVWKRLSAIFGFYDASDRLNFTHGAGRLSGRGPEATHCTNIGPVHRQRIHAALARWWGLAAPEKESSERRPAEQLHAMTEQAMERFPPKRIHAAALEIASRKEVPTRSLTQLRQTWSRLLGDVEPATPRQVSRESDETDRRVQRIVLETEPGILVPLLLMLPEKKNDQPSPVVIGVAQAGKETFRQRRSDTIARLLDGGAAVCLPDLRGMGETRPGDSRGRASSATSLSASAWMLGHTMLGWRLKDLRSVCRWLQSQEQVDATRLVLWGESFAPPNNPQREIAVPWDAEGLPSQSEPGGALLALLGGLFEDHVRGVYGRGGLVSFTSLLEEAYVYVPHDCVVPGVLGPAGSDLPEVLASLKSRPLRWETPVDGVNRPLSQKRLDQMAAVLTDATPAAKPVSAQASSEEELARWLLAAVVTGRSR